MNVTPLTRLTGAANLSGIPEGGNGVSLDNMLRQAVTELDAAAESSKLAVEAGLNSSSLTNPANLIAMQARLSDYNIFISLASTVARKGVGVVETIVKGQ